MDRQTRRQPDAGFQVFPDGSSARFLGPAGLQLPEPLRALALGFLNEGEQHVEFIWTADASGLFWSVALSSVMIRGRSVARLTAWRSDKLPFGVSRRELDVVTLVASGLTNPAISRALVLSTRTVTTHIDHVMRKLQVTSRTAIAARALDSGLVGLPTPVEIDCFGEMRVGRIVRSAGRPAALANSPRERRVSRDEIVIGALIPLWGRGGPDGVEMLNGATLAIEEINRRGGVHGRGLRMECADADVDDRLSVETAVKGLLSQNVDVITSGYLAHQPAAIEAASIDGVPFMHSSASKAVETMVADDPRQHRNVFQFCPSDAEYAPNFVRFVSELRHSGEWLPVSGRLVVVHQSAWHFVDFGLTEADRIASQNGWELISLSVSDTDGDGSQWADAATSIRSLRPAAVMIGSYFLSDHHQFIETASTDRTGMLIYSIYAPSIPEFRRRLSALSEGIVWATTTGTYSDGLGRDFAARYTSRFGVAPGRSHAGISYDRIRILAQAWGQLDDPGDFDALSERVAETRYRGLNGAYSFSPTGHGTLALGSTSTDPSIAQAHTIFQIQASRNVLIYPKIYATGRYRSEL